MKYLKIFTDFMDVVEPLSDEERGRLFMAMLAYALDGSEPTLPGNERFVWAVAKQHINREVAAYKTKVETGRQAGLKSGAARRKQSEPKGTNVNQTNQDKDKDKDNDNDKNNDNDISFIPPEPAPDGEKKETHPALEDIVRYVQDAFLPVDAQHFYDYYEANGWRMGQNPIQDWKAALRAWARNAPVAPRPAARKPSSWDTFREVMEAARLKEAKEV